MKRAEVRYSPTFRPSPMTVWVHRRCVPVEAPDAEGAPPLPRPVAGKGCALLAVEFDGCGFCFASRAELDAFRDGRRPSTAPSSRAAPTATG